MSRIALSAKTRFEIFKRDGFKCQYCGATPPDVLLHVDHIDPVALGGDNDPDNLVTSCDRCNLGKGARPLDTVPKSLDERAEEVAEREAQIAAYAEIMEAARERLEADCWRVAEGLRRGASKGYPRARFESVKRFVRELGVHEALEAAEIAAARRGGEGQQFKYFCGICWNKIRRRDEEPF